MSITWEGRLHDQHPGRPSTQRRKLHMCRIIIRMRVGIVWRVEGRWRWGDVRITRNRKDSSISIFKERIFTIVRSVLLNSSIKAFLFAGLRITGMMTQGGGNINIGAHCLLHILGMKDILSSRPSKSCCRLFMSRNKEWSVPSQTGLLKNSSIS